ncbi:MAG TPA: DUF2478 domain-containing protein [Methylocystis sp.]|nr:DUF2478 domain-containing protein [Methylocystis sp.]
MADHAAKTPQIAALRADDSKAAQKLMFEFAQQLAQLGFRIGGLVQTRLPDAGGRLRVVLQDVSNGTIYRISQDLGRGSAACNLDNSELALACAAVERAAHRGCDLIVLSKFSKQEAGRSGLCDAFRAAMLTRTRVVAAVSPEFLAEWSDFAGRLAEFVACDRAALWDWWERRATVRHEMR